MDAPYSCLLLCVGLQVFFSTSVEAVDPLTVVTGPDGSYNITVLGVTWLRSAPAFFFVNGTRHSADDGSLQLESINTTVSGEGVFGAWVSKDFHYKAGDVPIVASVVIYGTAMITFKVRFVNGASNTSQRNLDRVICGFPGFRMDSEEQLGFMSFRGENLGFDKQSVGRWNHDADIQDGLEGSSPLTLFDTKVNSVTFGPLDNFLSTSMWRDNVNNFLYWGTMGGVNELPANFSYQIIAAYANNGVANSFTVLGFIMLNMYYKMHRPMDPIAEKIGYWTDEGSFYFGKGGTGSSNYEDTLIRVFSDARNNSIFYSYVEWDTWWFTKGSGGGVKKWSAPPDVFPHGEKYLQHKLNVPVVAKSTFWSRDNIYAKQNGGNYSFEIEGDMAIPLDESFWDFIFKESKEWGLATYIQDNMTQIYQNFPRMKTDINFCRDWLMKMAISAERHNITIQFSGAIPRIAMEASELPAVTQLKASPGYGMYGDQWKIGLTSVYGEALGAAVFKDVFLTTSPNGGSDGKSPERESLVATLSCGPVGIGDEIGHTNRSVVQRTSSSDGIILKPNVPAIATDPQIREMAFQDGSGPDGEVWATFSSVYKGGQSPNQQYGIIFVSGLTRQFDITPNKSIVTFEFPKSKIFSRGNPSIQYDFSEDRPFSLPACMDVDFCLYYTSPIITFQGEEVLILGELDKWVPMSNKRVQNVTVTDDMINIHVTGQPSERVKFWFASNGEISTLNIEISTSGFGTLVYKKNPTPINGAIAAVTSRIFLGVFVLITTYVVNLYHGLWT